MLEGLVETLMQFFSMEAIVETLSNPTSWGIILSLIIMEGLLSADNALVLASLVKRLPKEQQAKALRYGIIGAYVFRFLAIIFGLWLVKIWWIKVIGGAYLVKMAIDFFRELASDDEDDDMTKKGGLWVRLFGMFWGTVVTVELLDIAFSIDSVLAAFAISDQVWVLFLGGILGVLMMRFVAGLFLKLLDKIPELEAGAFIIILIIGTKMVVSAFLQQFYHLDYIAQLFIENKHTAETVEHVTLFATLFLVFGGTYLYHLVKVKKAAK